MRRKLVLFLALVAAVGFGFGWITEDLCCLGGSYADDPNSPVIAAEYALPAHSQAASRVAVASVVLEAARAASAHVGISGAIPHEHPAGRSSLQNPRRC